MLPTEPSSNSSAQTKNSAHLARIRDNQRRSRARRKEYLQELEDKFRRCEQSGIEASAEMQAAARKVLEENQRLRALLRTNGFTDAEMDSMVAVGPSESVSASSSLELLMNTRKACDATGASAGSTAGGEVASPILSNSNSIDSPTAPSSMPWSASMQQMQQQAESDWQRASISSMSSSQGMAMQQRPRYNQHQLPQQIHPQPDHTGPQPPSRHHSQPQVSPYPYTPEDPSSYYLATWDNGSSSSSSSNNPISAAPQIPNQIQRDPRFPIKTSSQLMPSSAALRPPPHHDQHEQYHMLQPAPSAAIYSPFPDAPDLGYQTFGPTTAAQAATEAAEGYLLPPNVQAQFMRRLQQQNNRESRESGRGPRERGGGE